MRSVFITGTDTGVGKTLIACGLLRALCRRGVRAIGMKPVVAGAEPGPHGLRYSDVDALREASCVDAQVNLINPYCIEAPIAPHIGAQKAGITIELERIHAAYLQLASRSDAVIVEGAGGLLVPLNDREDSADLALRLALPVVLVVGMRLGCLNHALLTRDAILGRGLQFAGWVANRLDVSMPVYEENLSALRTRLAAPLLAEVPHYAAPEPDRVAQLLEKSL